MIKTITSAITGLVNAIIKLITGIFNSIFGLFRAIFNGIVSVLAGIYNAIAMVGKKVINSFKPVYRVTFTMYHVIPGVPVQRNVTEHAFERGATKEAIAFYNKVVNMTAQNKIAPTEVKLFKGKKMIQIKQFGPIEDIKKFKMAA